MLYGTASTKWRKKSPDRLPLGLAMKFDIGEFARAINGDEQVELAFGGLHFGDVDMEEADRIAFEFGPRGFFAFHFGQTADAMTLQATVEG